VPVDDRAALVPGTRPELEPRHRPGARRHAHRSVGCEAHFLDGGVDVEPRDRQADRKAVAGSPAYGKSVAARLLRDPRLCAVWDRPPEEAVNERRDDEEKEQAEADRGSRKQDRGDRPSPGDLLRAPPCGS